MPRRIILALLISLVLLAACQSKPAQIAFADLPLDQADAGSGEKLFQQTHGTAPACNLCHTTEGNSTVGPALAGIARIAANRVNGQSAEEYLYWSIIQPSKYIVAGYSNLMYADYEKHLNAADIADIIAYLMTLE